ncbi:MAG: hypothetical protein AAF789_04045 [Bacteroidota bacterium]
MSLREDKTLRVDVIQTFLGDFSYFCIVKVLQSTIRFLLTASLLLATAGVSLSKHYCLGRLQSISINSTNPSDCKHSNEEMPCCEDVSELVKIEEVVNSESDLSFDKDQGIILIQHAPERSFSPVTQACNGAIFYYADPPLCKVNPANLQVFLI